MSCVCEKEGNQTVSSVSVTKLSALCVREGNQTVFDEEFLCGDRDF